MPCDEVQEGLQLERLAQYRGSTCPLTLRQMRLIRADEQDGYLGVMLAQVAEYGKPIDARQHNVQYDRGKAKLVLRAVHDPQSLGAVAGFHHRIARLLERDSQQPTHQAAIVDHQHGWLR